MNKVLLKMECGKAFRNRFFFIALGIGMLFSFLSFLYKLESYQFGMQEAERFSDDWAQVTGLYNSWIGGERVSLGFTLFFTLLPLLAAIPFGWSFCQERNSGYLKCIATRCSRRSYYLAKYMAVFLSGGAAVGIPLLFNFLLAACFIPAVKPSIVFFMYYAMAYPSMWSGIFYNHPLVFVMMYLILDFLFAGLFATMSYAFSLYIRNWFAVVILPYLVILVLHYCRGFLDYKVYVEISPLGYLHSLCIRNHVNGVIVFVEGMVFLLVPLILILREGVKGEIL